MRGHIASSVALFVAAIAVGSLGSGACTATREPPNLTSPADGVESVGAVRLQTGVVASPVSGWTMVGEGPNAHGARYFRQGAIAVLTTEAKEDHAAALNRLREIDAEQTEPSTFVSIAGYPGIARERVGPAPAIGRAPSGEAHDLLTVTRAYAAGRVVVRVEGSFPADAGVIGDIERILAAAVSSAKADPATAAVEVSGLTPLPGIAHAAPARLWEQQAPDTPLGQSEVTVRLLALPSRGTNRRIDAASNIEAETTVTASTDGKNILVANNSSSGSGIRFTTSNDFGQTFGAPQGATWANQGDASLAFAVGGNFYMAYVGGGGANCFTGMRISTDNGQTFPAGTNPYSSAVTFPDQEHIAADRVNSSASGKDRVYSVWRDFAIGTAATCGNANGGPTPSIVCSSDGGTTWTAKATVDTGDFPRVTVGSDGFVYVVYLQGNNIRLNKFSACDAGLTQQAGFPVTIVATSQVNCGAGGLPGLDRCNSGNDLRSPSVAVDDTSSQHVYVAYATNSAANNENVFVVDSNNGGKAFNAPVQINSNVTGHRFMPWVCSANGNAYLSWYDMRAGAAAGAASNDLTQYFGGSASVVNGTLTSNGEFTVSQTQDPLCASGWPGSSRSPNVPENCSVQPQLAGLCCNGATPPVCNATCDFSNCAGGGGSPGCTCGAGFSCTAPFLGGVPKYGDYNEVACASGRFYMTWASATPPPGLANLGINLYLACPPNQNDVNGTFADTTKPIFTTPPQPVTTNTCSSANLGTVKAVDPCGSAPATLTNNTPGTFVRGANTVTWSATDSAGNVATAPQTVTVGDTTPPVVTAPPDADIVSCSGGTVTVGTAKAVDDCLGAVTPTGLVIKRNGVALTPPIPVAANGTVSLPFGTYVIQWTASDGITPSTAVFQNVIVNGKIEAAGNFQIDDRASLGDTNGHGGVVLNAGNGTTSLGNTAASGAITSVASVTIGNGTTVSGNIVTSGIVTPTNPPGVSGTITTHAGVRLPALPALPSFPAAIGNDFQVNGTLTLTPNSYANVQVNSNSTLILTPGDFFFKSLALNSLVNVRIQVAPETRVFILNTLDFRSPFVNASGQLQAILVGFAGPNLVVETTFNGTLVAPNASVAFGIGSGIRYQGSFYAKNIEIRPGSSLVCDEGPTPPLPTGNPPPATCTDGTKDGNESDVDCGGPVCAACGAGKQCGINSDCVSTNCTANVCLTAPSPFTASILVTTDWGSGYCVEIIAHNGGTTPTTGWSVAVNLGQSRTFDTWNGTFAGSTGPITINAPFSWNKVIPPGGIGNTIGFCANRTPANSGALPVLTSATATF